MAHTPHPHSGVFDPDQSRRDAIARAYALCGPAATRDELNALALDRSAEVLILVAVHPNTSPHVLEKLSRNWSREVREAVAGNPHTPVPVLEALAEDTYVRMVVSWNPSAPARLVRKIDSCIFWQGWGGAPGGYGPDLVLRLRLCAYVLSRRLVHRGSSVESVVDGSRDCPDLGSCRMARHARHLAAHEDPGAALRDLRN